MTCHVCGAEFENGKRFIHLVIGSVGVLHEIIACVGCNNEIRRFHQMLRSYHQIEGAVKDHQVVE